MCSPESPIPLGWSFVATAVGFEKVLFIYLSFSMRSTWTNLHGSLHTPRCGVCSLTKRVQLGILERMHLMLLIKRLFLSQHKVISRDQTVVFYIQASVLCTDLEPKLSVLPRLKRPVLLVQFWSNLIPSSHNAAIIQTETQNVNHSEHHKTTARRTPQYRDK